MTVMLKSTDKAIAEAYRLALLDLDGVVYRGKNPVEHAADSIRAAEHAGMTIEYTTNNSSRFQRVVAEQLRGFGLDVEPHQVITSSVVAARMVARHVAHGTKVLVLGAEHLREEVSRQGLVVVDSATDQPQAVIQGWYPQMSWEQMAQVSYAVEQGATYFVTNRDLTIPRELGIAPGCGSMIQAVINATGVEPVASAGKPESAMYDEARLLAADGDDTQPVAKADCLAIGDRLDTDIEAGNRGGYDSLAVLTGVTNPHELMLAPAHLRPTYIAADLRGLLAAQPSVTRMTEGSWTCGGASARIVPQSGGKPGDGGFTLSVGDRGADGMDALRAACAAMWAFADDGCDASRVSLPDDAAFGR
ncbi:HAD-IIA family hydrolase [Bifidobacterium jacchi]|uniref:HAD-IIA family hydrolase n=1 Tax=Bifidobacterium jacchi TaxID=2490545 RepID=A0A5N5RPT8_9BIFI|nr:HAD-IIA family hydrolase [Bifidobacterium jacchi]KAB5608761.1 HAD-IIA family hydrolase [Bifidobacterium jacchi]